MVGKRKKGIEAELGEIYLAVAVEPEDDVACENRSTANSVIRILKKEGNAGGEPIQRKPIFTSVAQYKRWKKEQEQEQEKKA